MSVKELRISDAPISFIISDADNFKDYIKIRSFNFDKEISIAVIDRNQAHLLYLYLKERFEK